ncbi:MAG: PadR family transcriptional regulator [Actinomycetota bacterium]|nr:PadR family transcriptional regulator [Actinomycetota bacterium]
MITLPDLPDSCQATLGLVAIRPASGYDLVAFADRSIAYFWPIPRSRLYRDLARLEELGLVAGTHVPQKSAPDKRVYEITEAGQAVQTAWLEAPTLPAIPSRNGLLLKVFMARHTRPEVLEPVLRGYREAVELHLTDLQVIVDRLTDNPGAAFGRLTARWGVVHAEASLAWLDEAEALVAARSRGALADAPAAEHGERT